MPSTRARTDQRKHGRARWTGGTAPAVFAGNNVTYDADKNGELRIWGVVRAAWSLELETVVLLIIPGATMVFWSRCWLVFDDDDDGCRGVRCWARGRYLAVRYPAELPAAFS